jgi:hypothetical protein
MPWSRKLYKPIVLKDGRKIATLGAAREMMFSIPLTSRGNAKWRYLADLLKETAADMNYAPPTNLEKQLIVALRAEGLL